MPKTAARTRRPSRPVVDYQPRLLTVADLAMLPSDLPSGTMRYELDNGVLMILPLPDVDHAAVVSNLTAAFYLQGEVPGLGKVRCGGVGVLLWRNPDRVIGVDIAVITKSSLPIRRSPEDYLETMPELVVEVRSWSDTDAVVNRRVNDLLMAGVRVVWVPDPKARTVIEYRLNQLERVYSETDTLTIDDVIPGFSLPVQEALQV